MRRFTLQVPRLFWALALGVAGTTHAAPPTHVESPCSGTAEVVGWLGIAQFEDERTDEISNGRGNHAWRFSSEPRIAAVDPKGPAYGKLRPGDVLFAIESDHITTETAARRLANARPGVSIDVTVKRDGGSKKVRIVPQRACSDDPRVLELQAELAAASRSPSKAQPELATVPMPALLSLADLDETLDLPPRGHFGIGLRCSDCNISRDEDDGPLVWHFPSAPEIYSVEPESPADRAGVERGDVLTHVDGVRIVTADGARRFGLARPGDRVEWTVRRRGDTKKIQIVAVERPERRQINARRGKEVAELNALIRKLRESQGLEAAQEHLDRLEELARELSDRAPRVIVVPTKEPARTGRPDHLRYAGSVGDSEIEVRGASEVVVTEEAGGEALTINAGDTTIRIRHKPD